MKPVTKNEINALYTLHSKLRNYYLIQVIIKNVNVTLTVLRLKLKHILLLKMTNAPDTRLTT